MINWHQQQSKDPDVQERDTCQRYENNLSGAWSPFERYQEALLPIVKRNKMIWSCDQAPNSKTVHQVIRGRTGWQNGKNWAGHSIETAKSYHSSHSIQRSCPPLPQTWSCRLPNDLYLGISLTIGQLISIKGPVNKLMNDDCNHFFFSWISNRKLESSYKAYLSAQSGKKCETYS